MKRKRRALRVSLGDVVAEYDRTIGMSPDAAHAWKERNMDRTKDPRVSSTGGVTPGYEDQPAPGPTKPNGQAASYWILSEEERANGFKRPVRRSYIHTGPRGPTGPTRPLSEREVKLYGDEFALYEEFAPERAPEIGRASCRERV